MNAAQHLKLLHDATLALEAARKAIEAGDLTQTKAIFGDQGVGAQAIKALQTTSESLVGKNGLQALAFSMLERVGHPFAELHQHLMNSQLVACMHTHRHGVSSFYAVVNDTDTETLKDVLMEYDGPRFEFERDDEFLDVTIVGLPDFEVLDLREVVVPQED